MALKLTDEQVLAHITTNVTPGIEKKFRDGMAKYSSPLIEKDCLAEAMPEVFDLVVYLAAAKLQRDRVRELVEQLYTHGSREDWWQELRALLEPRPLAVKKTEKPPEAKPPEGSDYEAFCRFMRRYAEEGMPSA